MEELMRLAFIEGYKQRALSGNNIFDETSKNYADALFDKWIDKGQKLPIHNVIKRHHCDECEDTGVGIHGMDCMSCELSGL
jgi:hypothetical protein